MMPFLRADAQYAQPAAWQLLRHPLSAIHISLAYSKLVTLHFPVDAVADLDVASH